MSTPVEELETEVAPPGGGHAHLSDLQYMGIAAILAVLTAIEVGVYYLKADTAVIVLLLVLMALKFSVVVAFFMHLRFDSPILRRLFVTGLVLAVVIYSVTLFILGIYHV